MGRRSLYGAGLVLLALGARDAWAQSRVITGRVVSTQTGQPIGGARVSVVGTVIVAVTNDRGEYSLAAPSGEIKLLTRGVGYKRHQVAVTADQQTADFALEQDIFNLEAVVVTGQATAVEQRNLANAVATIAPEVLTRAPTPTLESAVQGKIPGALVQTNSGAPGGGAQITLRGVSTINGSVNPLIVVDGLVISNDAIASNMNAITAAGAGGNASSQDNPVNRLADLNPADIQNVEVLKGASAAAIYGSQAANGVIIITTKRGQTGRPKFTLTQRFGEFRLAHKLGQRRFTDSADAVSAFGSDKALAGQLCRNGCPFYDFEQELYGQQPLSFETDGSVSGGTDQTSYFISGLVKRDGGIAPNTGYDKQSLRANIDQLLGSRFHLSVNTQLIHSLANRGISNNDNTGTSTYLVLPFTPSFFNLEPTNGVYPTNPYSPSNPLQTFALLKNAEDLWRVLGTTKLRVDALTSGPHHLQFDVFGGLDYFELQNDILSPPDLQYEPQDGQPGTVVLGKTSNRILNLTGSAIYSYSPASGRYSATTSAGFQFQDNNLNQTNAVGRTILAGQQNLNQAATITIAAQAETPVRAVGLYAQEEVLALDQRLLVTAGVRADRSSVNGDTHKYYFFPKTSASYRFVTPFSGVDELKVRAAIGQTGNPPQFGQKFTPEGTGTIGGLFGTLAGGNAGAIDIRPERQTETEAGFDATLAHEFATFSFTYYDKTISDLLLVARVAPSTGRTNRIFNGGKLRNRGQEIAASISPIRRPDFTWILRSTFSRNRSLVVELPVPAFNTGGFGTSLGAFRIEQGKSATQIVGTEGVVGNSEPKFQMSLANDLTWKQWNFGFLWDWKKGGDVINLTQLLYDAGGNSPDQVPAGNQRITDWAVNGKTKTYVQDGSYLKLREVTLSYELPASVASHLFGGVRYAKISVSGRNLIRITPYKGMDPEVSNFGNQAIARNIDVAPFPPSRSFFFSIDLGF